MQCLNLGPALVNLLEWMLGGVRLIEHLLLSIRLLMLLMGQHLLLSIRLPMLLMGLLSILMVLHR